MHKNGNASSWLLPKVDAILGKRLGPCPWPWSSWQPWPCRFAVGHHGCWDLELVAVAQWSLLGPRAAHATRFDAGMLQVHKHVLHVCNMTTLPQSDHFSSQEHCFGWPCLVTHPAASIRAMRATPENHGCLENSTTAEFLRAALLVVLLFLLDASIGMEDHGPGKNKTRAEGKMLLGQGPDALAWSNCWISLA